MFSLPIIGSLIGVAVLLVIFLWLGLNIHDWGRDFTTNFAATSEDATNAAERPIHSSHSCESLADITVASAEKLRGWKLSDRQKVKLTNGLDGVEMHFVRTTPLWRFQDDIRVRIEALGEGSMLSAESRSRVGKGDLGQNPRNLRELLAQVRLTAD